MWTVLGGRVEVEERVRWAGPMEGRRIPSGEGWSLESFQIGRI